MTGQFFFKHTSDSWKHSGSSTATGRTGEDLDPAKPTDTGTICGLAISFQVAY